MLFLYLEKLINYRLKNYLEGDISMYLEWSRNIVNILMDRRRFLVGNLMLCLRLVERRRHDNREVRCAALVVVVVLLVHAD